MRYSLGGSGSAGGSPLLGAIFLHLAARLGRLGRRLGGGRPLRFELFRLLDGDQLFRRDVFAVDRGGILLRR